jgi:hypothetical protein
MLAFHVLTACTPRTLPTLTRHAGCHILAPQRELASALSALSTDGAAAADMHPKLAACYASALTAMQPSGATAVKLLAEIKAVVEANQVRPCGVMRMRSYWCMRNRCIYDLKGHSCDVVCCGVWCGVVWCGVVWLLSAVLVRNISRASRDHRCCVYGWML